MKKILIYSSIILTSLSLGAMEETTKKRKTIAPRPPAMALPTWDATEQEIAFIEAAGQGNVAKVKKILTNRPQSFNINAFIENKDWYEGTALTCAVFQGHTEIVKLLLKHDADPNVRAECDEDEYSGDDSATPLLLAVANNNSEIAKLLIEHKADVNAIGSVINEVRSSTPLHYAADTRNTELVKLLLSHDAKVNCTDGNECTPLYYACVHGSFEIFQELLNHGAYITREEIGGRWALPLDSAVGAVEGEGRYPLDKNAEKNRIKIALKILESHKPAHGRHVISGSSLIGAAIENMPEVVKALLENCRDINIHARDTLTDKNPRLTALEAALSYGSDECALLLLENGAQWAIEGFLKRNGERVRYSNPILISNLAFAAVYGKCPKALAYFIEHGINLDTKLDKWRHNNRTRKNLSLQEFAKLCDPKAMSILLRACSIKPRKRIEAALLAFNRLMKEKTIPNLPKDVIREILSYLIDDVIAGAAYTKELVPDYEYLKETITTRFTPKDKEKTLRTPRVNKEVLLKALGLEDEGNEPLDPSNP